ncbi:C2 calcium-dependent domain-containing protein 4C-like [Scomber scombrus]|uniref:C2 calcium-dependent domain-containing protein 4C-like n=1 Tax=Scomber scombrus TaxID=13677 RepID=A0AAV1QJD3_SCOSC
MSAVKSGAGLRSLLLTPDRIPRFIIPSPSSRLFPSPRLHRGSADRNRLLSEPDDDSPSGSPETRLSPAASPRYPSRFLLRLAPRVRAPVENADTDLTTRAAMSLPHVGKVTTCYGFRAVLAASPCTRRRESLFHQNKPVTVTVTEPDQQDSDLPDPADPLPPGSGARRSRIPRAVKALGVQMMKELKKPAATLKALSPAKRRTDTC